jgi:plastocyanin
MKHGRILAAALLLAGAALPLHAQTRIQVGQTVRGSLASSDAVMEDGSHYDPYTLSARAGQSVTITMRSSSFDTYLSVGRVSGGSFQALGSDDDGAGGTDSQVSVTFPSAGEYVIRANSLAADGAGDYTLEVAAGGSGGVSPSPSSGGGVLDMLLDTTAVMMRNGGLSPRGAPVRGSLGQGATQDLTFQLSAASTLAIVGVCDESCSDLDLAVFGPNGNELGSDVLEDDAPIVKLDNVRAGTYRVRVTMAACSGSSCGFGVRVFGN